MAISVGYLLAFFAFFYLKNIVHILHLASSGSNGADFCIRIVAVATLSTFFCLVTFGVSFIANLPAQHLTILSII